MCQRLTDAPFSLQLINLNVKHIKHIVTGKIKAHNTQHIGAFFKMHLDSMLYNSGCQFWPPGLVLLYLTRKLQAFRAVFTLRLCVPPQQI